MRFLDRTDETKRLEKALASEKPSFIVMYGRRRLGKSTLMAHVLSDTDIYFMADNSDQLQQMELLAKVVNRKFADFDKLVYPDWETLLRELNHRSSVKFTLCLDEFPYLVKSCPSLPSTLQRLIDAKCLKYNIVICGSSQHLMHGLVLDATAPLYGRADQIIKLYPIGIKYLQQALEIDAASTVEEYAVWGGVPRYWEIRKAEESFMEAIFSQVANVNGLLYDEPDRLFADDISSTGMASSILSLIGSGACRLSEIASRLGKKATDLSGPLARLADLGYIEREIPFGDNPKNSKKGVYKIIDPFMSFFYRFVIPQRSLISLGRRTIVEKYISDNFADFVAKRWETLCQRAVSGNQLYGITWNVASRWWGNVDRNTQVEFDLVAESMDKQCLLIGECKWTRQENAASLLADLRHRAEKFPHAKNHKVYYALFLKNPPIDGENSNVFLPQDVINEFS
ncbi:MAG: ATP-binding protein [Prevotellaceae bacterium]|nr:ATP-binding protein [Prevotellaceae bacterium]